METLFGPVSTAFEIKGRGCLVGVENGQVATGVVLAPGDAVELRFASGKPIRTVVRDIGGGRQGKGGFVGVLLGPEVSSAMVPEDAEL